LATTLSCRVLLTTSVSTLRVCGVRMLCGAKFKGFSRTGLRRWIA
jgi:hypothetical protein